MVADAYLKIFFMVALRQALHIAPHSIEGVSLHFTFIMTTESEQCTASIAVSQNASSQARVFIANIWTIPSKPDSFIKTCEHEVF